MRLIKANAGAVCYHAGVHGEDYLDLDVRPLVAAKAPPLAPILDAVGQLAPGQALRLTAPFEPVPLYGVLGRQGFRHEARREPDGAWVIVFRRA